MLKAPEKFIDLVLKTQRATHRSSVKFIRGNEVDDLPIAVALPDLFERCIDDISDVILFVSVVEEHTARRDEART